MGQYIAAGIPTCSVKGGPEEKPQLKHGSKSNLHRDFVIASQGEMASFPAGTTPFFP
jgi:hypothetical protein